MAGFNPYNANFYLQDLQNMKDRIEKQLQQYQNQFMQNQQQAPITQNFQIAPTQPQSELQAGYVNNIEDVKNTFVIKNGIFVNKEFTNLWLKDVTGNIKTYDLKEVIELDEKDKALIEKDNMIDALKSQIDELKGVINYATNKQSNTERDDVPTTNKPSRVSKNKSDDAE